MRVCVCTCTCVCVHAHAGHVINAFKYYVYTLGKRAKPRRRHQCLFDYFASRQRSGISAISARSRVQILPYVHRNDPTTKNLFLKSCSCLRTRSPSPPAYFAQNNSVVLVEKRVSLERRDALICFCFSHFVG